MIFDQFRCRRDVISACEEVQRRSEGFWRPGRRLLFCPRPPKKFEIHQNLRNRLNCSQNLAI